MLCTFFFFYIPVRFKRSREMNPYPPAVTSFTKTLKRCRKKGWKEGGENAAGMGALGFTVLCLLFAIEFMHKVGNVNAFVE